MTPALKILGAAAFASGLAVAGPAAAQSDPHVIVPAWGAWGGPGAGNVGWTVSNGPSWLARALGHGPVGCYFTRVRANNRWLPAQICDWY
jgi:hypothetical protein